MDYLAQYLRTKMTPVRIKDMTTMSEIKAIAHPGGFAAWIIKGSCIVVDGLDGTVGPGGKVCSEEDDDNGSDVLVSAVFSSSVVDSGVESVFSAEFP